MAEEYLDFSQALDLVASSEAIEVSLEEIFERAPDCELARLLYGE